jgi:hypothetical protein
VVHATFAQIGLSLRESREILDYLQCDAKSENPVVDHQLSLSMMCLTSLGRQ